MEVVSKRSEFEVGGGEGSVGVGALAVGAGFLRKHWSVLPRRTQALIGVLLLLCGMYLYSVVELRISAGFLEKFAQKEINGVHSDSNDVVWEVTVSRPFILFGQGQGKVEVFVLQKVSSGPRPELHSVSFFYVEDGNSWRLDGSEASGSEERQAAGLKAFARQKPDALKGK